MTSSSSPPVANTRGGGLPRWIRQGAPWLVLAAVVGVGGYATWQAFRGKDDANAGVAKDVAAAADDGPASEVRLTDEKVEFAGIHVTEASRRVIRESRAVPGKLAYDGGKHLDVTAPLDCVVIEVLVEPGQKVAAGDKIVRLSSAEIGRARDEVLQRTADWMLAKREHVWAEEISDNVEKLLATLAKRPPLEEIERDLDTRALGAYRERLVAAYSKLQFAERVSTSSAELEQKGVVSQRLLEERKSNREVASATFKGACESARFEAQRDHSKAHAAELQAHRLLAIAQNQLATLLGPQGSIDEAAQVEGRAAKSGEGEGEQPPEDADLSKLSEFVVRAPFAGRIERRGVVVSARVPQGKSLVTLADTSRLWVEAEIHERDWKALEHSSEGEIAIRVPALGDVVYGTKLLFVGGEVSQESRSVPLVTEVSNQEGKLKPGMFVWVDVPLGASHEACVAPAGAIMRHEGTPFVFVPLGENRYRRVDVKLGLESGGWIEILSGLEAGQPVVDQGTFYLKSELLLDKEAE
ncbi:MAG: efflux RND transporter periplasmic adaptor subunit [Pirellulales bacterium]